MAADVVADAARDEDAQVRLASFRRRGVSATAAQRDGTGSVYSMRVRSVAQEFEVFFEKGTPRYVAETSIQRKPRSRGDPGLGRGDDRSS